MNDDGVYCEYCMSCAVRASMCAQGVWGECLGVWDHVGSVNTLNAEGILLTSIHGGSMKKKKKKCVHVFELYAC